MKTALKKFFPVRNILFQVFSNFAKFLVFIIFGIWTRDIFKSSSHTRVISRMLLDSEDLNID